MVPFYEILEIFCRLLPIVVSALLMRHFKNVTLHGFIVEFPKGKLVPHVAYFHFGLMITWHHLPRNVTYPPTDRMSLVITLMVSKRASFVALCYKPTY